MQFFDTNPNRFRIFFSILAASMLVVAFVSLYRFASSPTDENVFRTSPSDLYITHNIPAQQIFTTDFPASEQRPNVVFDTIRVGDLILSINDEVMTRPKHIQEFLDKLSPDSSFNLVVFRPSISDGIEFKVQRSSLSDSSFRDIPATVYVSQVTRGGASDRAGLQVGDLIHRINNQRFKDEVEAQQILREGQSGNTLAYDIIRNNNNLTLSITLASVGIRLAALILILSGLVYILMGIFIAIIRPQFKAARLLGLSFIALGFFLMIIYPTISSRFTPYDNFTFFREVFTLICVFYSFPLWLHMAHYFPIERDELRKRKWIRYGSYGLATLFFSLVIVTGNYFFFPIGFITLGIYNNIPWFFRKERSDEYKKFNRIIFHTSLAIGAIILLMLVGLIAFEATFGSRAPGAPPPNGIFTDFFRGYFGLPLMLIPFAYLFTIGHYRLLDLDLRVKRNIQYSIVSMIWSIALLAVLLKALFYLPEMSLNLPNIKFEGSFIEVLDQPMDDQDRINTEKLAVIFLGIFLTWGAWRFRRFVQRFIDLKFDRAQFDYRKAASELAEVMAAQFTMEALADGIVRKLAELMQVKQVGVLFFRNEKECCCSVVYGLQESRWKNFSDSINTRIIKVIQTNKADYRFSVDYLPDDIQVLFEQNGFKHIIAIRSKEKLVGVLLIGEKRSESPFHKDDLMFLAAVAKQASVAIENAFLYDELAEQERMRHELNIARRIQLASLPQTTPKISGLDIAGISIPAQEVGGDYYDYLNGAAADLTVIIGDVSGKGTSAALYMSKVQGIMRSLNDFGLSPRDLFIRAKQLLIKDMEKQSFITAMGAAFDAKKQVMQLARAGHSPLYHFCAATGAVNLHTPKGIGLGLTKSEHFSKSLEELELHYAPGDVFLFITDGITEAQNTAHLEYGDAELLDLLKQCNGHSAKRLRDQIIASVNQFAGAMPQHDDLTVVVVKAI
ncbi:MAG: SpoIIE family protein phosphatase [Calditrichaeota bacterium]|nr:SpoIIE family protein phosphatase [Calditrichota bacterium]